MNPYLQQTLNPFKRWWELQQQYAQQGMGLMAPQEEDSTLKDVGTGLLGGALYAASPIISGFQAFRDEPLRDTMIQAGMDPEKAQTAAHWIGGAMDVGGIGLAKKGLNIGSEVARRVGPKGPNMGNVALTQDITRRTHGYQEKHPAGLPDWYGGKANKAAHLALGMVPRALLDMGQRIIDPRASYVFGKYGISPANSRELQRMFKYLEEGGKKEGLFRRVADDAPEVSKTALRNEIHSQLAYISSVFRKYMPNDKRREAFEAELGPHLFPKQRLTTADNIATDSKSIRDVLDLPIQISDEGINAHIGSFIPTSFGKRLRGDISLNSKPYQEAPGATMSRMRGREHRVFKDFQKVLGMMMPGQKLNSKTLLDEARLYNELLVEQADNAYQSVWKAEMPKAIKKSGAFKKNIKDERRHLAHKAADSAKQSVLNKKINIERLEKSMRDEAGYISVGAPSLSSDRLLAHINNRIIVKSDGSLEGVWVTFDQMKQGSGYPGVEQFLDMGSKNNFIALDVQPLRIGMGREGRRAYYNTPDIESMSKEFGMPESIMKTKPVIEQTPLGRFAKITDRDKALRGATERMMYERPDSAYLRRWGLKRAAGAGAVGAPVGAGLLSDDERKRKRGAGLLAY